MTNMRQPSRAHGGYSVREADLDVDAASIAALWAENLAGHDLHSANTKLSLGYRDNPAGGASVQLLMVQGEQQAQGAQGLHTRRFWLGKRPLRGAGLADFVVNVAHRSLWPALLLMQHCTQMGAGRFELIYGFPNPKAVTVCERGGLKRFGQIQRYATPLASRVFLSRRMPVWLAHTAALFVDIALRVRDRLYRLLAMEQLVCKPIDWAHPAIDALWSRRPETLMLSERSSEMLHWRFAAPGRGDWRLCLANDAQNVAQGYVVWRDRQGLAEVGDFFAADPARWTAPLLRAFVEIARAEGMRTVSVEFFGARQVTEQIRRAGLGLRPERRSIFTSKVLPPGLEAQDSWYITGFDDDADPHPRPRAAQ